MEKKDNLKIQGIGDMIDTEKIEEETKKYQYTLDKATKELIEDSLKRVKERTNNSKQRMPS